MYHFVLVVVVTFLILIVQPHLVLRTVRQIVIIVLLALRQAQVAIVLRQIATVLLPDVTIVKNWECELPIFNLLGTPYPVLNQTFKQEEDILIEFTTDSEKALSRYQTVSETVARCYINKLDTNLNEKLKIDDKKSIVAILKHPVQSE